MTGSIPQLARQHSSTATNSNLEKTQKVKVRRSSSADDSEHPLALELKKIDTNEVVYRKRESTIIDYDSGTEEIEQQLEQIYFPTIDVQEDNTFKPTTGSNADEGFSEYESEEKSKVLDIKNDLILAKTIPDDTKKDFCHDTTEAFHGEFARLISIPLNLHYGARYFLFAEGELPEGFYENLLCHRFIKVDNAKAQFKCTNPFCRHAWTSMRSRISFTIHGPNPGFIKLEILGQDCQYCGTYADAVWYIDEVCRVMKNLAKCVFETYFPDMLNCVDLETRNSSETNMKQSYLRHHDPTQRKGKMHAPHVKELCVACRRGLCFA
ncbi:hypothetical protein I4U23_000274 [Adineta vaga]|nr:hypothetical protein I4U23_000274 [Adineta vaga]